MPFRTDKRLLLAANAGRLAFLTPAVLPAPAVGGDPKARRLRCGGAGSGGSGKADRGDYEQSCSAGGRDAAPRTPSAMPRYRTGPGRRARESSPTKAGTAEVGELVEGRDDGGKVIESVVVDRARRRCRLRPGRWVDAGVGVVRARPGDAVSGCRIRLGCGGPVPRGVLLCAGCPIRRRRGGFCSDLVQILFGRGLLLSQPQPDVAGCRRFEHRRAGPGRQKLWSAPTISPPACVHLDRPARSGERAGQNVGRRLRDFDCAQTSGATSAGTDRRVRTARRAGGRPGRSPRPRRRRARRRRPRRRRAARTGRPRRG